MRLALLTFVLALALPLAGAAGCATFDAPPEVTIEGLKEGLLSDPTAPIVLEFSKKPVASTIKLEIAPYIVDVEGNLSDEVDGGKPLDSLYAYDPVAGDTGGSSVLAKDGMSLTITPTIAPPIGPSLVLVVEAGLEDEAGTETKVRRRLVFGYAPSLTCTKPVSLLTTGTYFFLANVSEPIHVQVQLFGIVDIDPDTGAVKSRFTKGKRNPDPNRCPMPCDSTHVCRLLPMPECALSSDPAGSVDEYSDYIPNPDPPTGFSFAVEGCATQPDAMSAAFTTEKVDVQVSSPSVTLKQTQLSASFAADAQGVLRGTGSLTADDVLLGTFESGKGSGDLTARSIKGADVPPGIPGP